MKPLQATWLISFYYYISSPEGKAVIVSEWQKSGIFDVVELRLSKLPVLDPFNDICPLMEVIPPKETLNLASLFLQELESYKVKVADETDENKMEWEVDDADEDPDTDVHNAFDMFGDE